MARRVTTPVPGSHVRFSPFGDDLVVIIKAPSEADRREHLAEVARIAEANGGQYVVTYDQAIARRRVLLDRWVLRVEGYEDSAGKPIETVEDLWVRGEDAVADRAETEIMRLLQLGEVQKKDSGKPSASSPAETHPSSGAAESASSLASVNGADAIAPAAIPSSVTAPS